MAALLSWKIFQYFFKTRIPSASILTRRGHAADTPQTLTQTMPLTLCEQEAHRGVFPGGNGITLDLLSLFVERTDQRINSEGSYGWKFKVQRIDPLASQHQAIQQAISSLFAKVENQGVLTELDSWTSYLGNDCFETVKTEAMVVLRLSDLTKDCSETLKSILNDCFETLNLHANDCFETLLKILKIFKDSQKDKDTSTNQNTSETSTIELNKAVVEMADSLGLVLNIEEETG